MSEPEPSQAADPVEGVQADAHAAALAELRATRTSRSPQDRLMALLGDRRPPRWVRAAAVATAVLVALGSWVVLRRPPDPIPSLPRASDGPSQGSSPEGGTSAGPSGGQAASTSVLPVDEGRGTDGTITVHVAGAVLRPGVVSLPAGARAVDAVSAAGGLAPGADPDRVNLAAPLDDGVRLAIPLVGQPVPAEVVPQAPGGSGAPGTSGQAAQSGPVDLNAADAAQLDELPGVGPSTAAAIISHRDENGPFTSVDELLDVRGIGDAKLDALRDLVTVGP